VPSRKQARPVLQQQDKTVKSYLLPVDVLADADEAVGVLEEHLLQRDHHALEVPRPLLDVVADLQCVMEHIQGQY
jgi:hypothetical protein